MNDMSRGHAGGGFEPGSAQPTAAPAPPEPPNIYARLARFSAVRPYLIIAIYVALAAAGLILAALRLDVDTDPARMIARGDDFRQDFLDFVRDFPALDNNFVVTVESDDPALARQTARSLATAMRARPDQFSAVHAPGTSQFFDDHGLLYLASDEVSRIVAEIRQALPVIQGLADDPTLRGLARLVADIRAGVEFGMAPPAISDFFRSAAATVETAIEGEPRPLDWTRLGIGEAPFEERQWFVIAKPELDFTALEPAEAALSVARRIVADPQFSQGGRVRVALTGEAAINAEELETVTEGAAVAGVISFVLVTLIIVLGFPAVRLVIPALIMLLLGILITAGFATLTVGYLNMISIAFAVLFIGLGVDYAIHVILRYSEEARETESVVEAIVAGAQHTGPALATCLLTTALAFLAFTPTEFIGMAQLGIIAAAGVTVAFLASLTLIPAVLSLMRRPQAGTGLLGGLHRPGAVRRLWMIRAASTGGVLLLAVLAAFAMPYVRFDGDPVKLKDPASAAVMEFQRLLAEDPEQVYAAQAVVEPGAPARELAARLSALPSVAGVRTVEDFIPSDQNAKLAQLATLKDAIPSELDTEREIDAEGRRAALDGLKQDLVAIAAVETAPAELTEAAERWQQALVRFDSPEPASPEEMGRLEAAFFANLPALLERLDRIANAVAVTLDNLDPDVKELFVAPDGRWRVEAVPAVDMRSESNLRRFASEVRSAAGNATGAPIEIAGAADIVSSAMRIATIAALGLVVLVLIPLMRRLSNVLLVLAPLLLAGLLLLGYTVLADSPFNFANVIVLPLLVGLGVHSSIHYVMRAREEVGKHEIAETSTPRAVLLSAVTTIGSFGTLWLSSHRGVSSMGELLTVSIVITLVCTLLVLPQLIAWTIGQGRPLTGGPSRPNGEAGGGS